MFYVEIIKTNESEREAEYRFQGGPGTPGTLRIDKQTGEVTVTAPHGDDPNGYFAARATRKVLLHWRQGSLPDKTCWAS